MMTMEWHYYYYYYYYQYYYDDNDDNGTAGENGPKRCQR